MFAAWGRFVYRFRWPVLVAALALVVASVVGIGALTTHLSSDSTGGNDRAESWRAAHLVSQELPAQGTGFTVIFTAKDPQLEATAPAFRQAMEAALAPLRADPRVAAIAESPAFVSRDGRSVFVQVTMRDPFDQALKEYDAVRAELHSDTLDVVATGNLPLSEDFNKASETDLRRAEVVALPLAVLLLTAVFGMVLWRLLRRSSWGTARLALVLTGGTFAIALVPIVIGGFAFLGGLAGIYALAHARDMSLYSLNIASMIGLGLAIDYSLFLISRFIEEVAARPVPEAVERTVATTGKAIAFSGLTVAIGVTGLLFYHSSMLTSIGLAAILVVACAVCYGLTFLPALMSIAGNAIQARARRHAAAGPALTAAPEAPRQGIWHALAFGVMRRPWAILLPLLALLLAAGTPFLHLRLGLTSPTALPTTLESRQGYDLLTHDFPGGETTSVLVVVDYPDGQPLTPARAAALYDYSRWLGGLPGVAQVQNPVNLPGPDGRPLPKKEQVVALLSGPRAALPTQLQRALHQSVRDHIVALTVLTPLPADSDGARQLVRTIRAGGGPNPGGAVLVGGNTAFTLDLSASIEQDTKVAAAFIMGATYVVLFLLLGSVLLPLKAVAMNLLSISASYGALVWIFQDGHLSGWLNFTPSSIEPTVPVLMFCLLFGLSMDYEVLLLSRMKEEFDHTGDNRHAVAEGLEQTGRLITGAAAIMVSVFAAFALADVVIIKALGLGMALAIAVDALLVRTLIVPATMRLLGNLNWWAPAPLARLYRRLGLGHESGAPARAPALPPIASLILAGDLTGEPEDEPVGSGRGR
ncbi:MAG TPA: MMPL family transporter [Thermomicrobiales bacterium]|nr:MMPL family transporter [Thermomicrobiales bacterium]